MPPGWAAFLKRSNKSQRLENWGARRAAFRPYSFLPPKGWPFGDPGGDWTCSAEVNSAYNNSPLRCELTRDFARGTRGTLKCSGEVNSPCANAFAQQKHFTAQKRRGNGVGRSACADWECAALLPRSGNARWSAGLMTMDAASIETAGRSCPVGQFAMGVQS